MGNFLPKDEADLYIGSRQDIQTWQSAEVGKLLEDSYLDNLHAQNSYARVMSASYELNRKKIDVFSDDKDVISAENATTIANRLYDGINCLLDREVDSSRIKRALFLYRVHKAIQYSRRIALRNQAFAERIDVIPTQDALTKADENRSINKLPISHQLGIRFSLNMLTDEKAAGRNYAIYYRFAHSLYP